jgi:hypothetical protein
MNRRSAASEGVPAALRLSKSAQSADKVHFSDSSGFQERPGTTLETGVSYHAGSGHKRSLPSMVDQIDAIFITKGGFRRPKIVLIRPKIAKQEATRLITLPARDF